jgi:hypothetical protein
VRWSLPHWYRLGRRSSEDRSTRCHQTARSYRAGDLTAVWVPDEAHEALRDLVRAREAGKQDELRARHRLSKFLLRCWCMDTAEVIRERMHRDDRSRSRQQWHTSISRNESHSCAQDTINRYFHPDDPPFRSLRSAHFLRLRSLRREWLRTGNALEATTPETAWLLMARERSLPRLQFSSSSSHNLWKAHGSRWSRFLELSRPKAGVPFS